jgi:hypothetical protein
MKIYLAAPFTNIAVPHPESKYGWVPENKLLWLKNLLNSLEALGHKVTFPYRDYHDWGKNFPELDKLCKEQFNEITKNTDLLIAYLGSPQSAGVAIEIGYAVSNNVPVIIIKQASEKITLVAYGLNAISKTKIIEFDDFPDLLSKISAEIRS